jgi:hypothetical protein
MHLPVSTLCPGTVWKISDPLAPRSIHNKPSPVPCLAASRCIRPIYCRLTVFHAFMYFSMHCVRHVCSPADRLAPGRGTHFSKQFSLTFCDCASMSVTADEWMQGVAGLATSMSVRACARDVSRRTWSMYEDLASAIDMVRGVW